MAIKAIKRESSYTYIPLEERGEEKPTTFTFRLLTKEEKAKLEDKLVKVNQDETINISNSSYILGAFRLCVDKVENFIDEKGAEIPVRKSGGLVSEEFMNLLPDEVITEIGNVIINISKNPAQASLFLGE